MGKRMVRFCVPVALNDYLRSGLGTLEQFLIPHGLSRCGGSRTKALADYGTIHGMVFPILLLPNTVLFAVSDLLVPRLARYNAERLVYFEHTTDVYAAISREKQIKSWNRERKNALVESMNPNWDDLYQHILD